MDKYFGGERTIVDRRDDNHVDGRKVKALVTTLKCMCDLAGFELESRVRLKDKKTGRIWK